MSENERLPIKFFAKRVEDSQRVEGMSNPELPKWVLADDELQNRANNLKNEFEQIFATTDWIGRNEVPVVIKAELNKDALAKSHRRKVESVFSTKMNNVVGMYDEKTILVKVTSQNEQKAMRNNLVNFKQNTYGISGIEKIEPFSPKIDKKVLEKDNYKVRLIDFQDYSMNEYYKNKFKILMEKNNVEYKETKYSENLTIYKMLSISSAELDALNENHLFDLAYEIVPMPEVEIELDILESEKDVAIKQYNEAEKSVTVGVLDNGIEQIEQLEPWIEGKRKSPYPDSLIEGTHGTYVAGIIVYGDELQNERWVDSQNIKVFDAAIYPNTKYEPLEEDELIANIREIIKEKHREINIWNLSISISREIDDDKFSDFAIALDDIQNKYNVFICKSAGNCKNFSKGDVLGKLHEGADSVRSLVVGSIANVKQGLDIAEINNPSPFSRRGPGPAYIIKPEIVHYGGNAGVNSRGSILESGMYSFAKTGEITEHAGTSFSTPRISSLAAGLYREMDEEFDPLLLKALIIHSANYPDGYSLPEVERTKYSGFGLPSGVKDILYNSPHEATLILRDTMPKGQYIDVKDFPMPECLIKDGFYTGKIIVTLVYDPVLDSSQGFEYCQSNMDIKFGSYDLKVPRDTSKNYILNPVGRSGTKNLLRGSLYSKTKMRNSTEEFALKERMMIQYGDKYYPVKKYAVDLNELTDGNKEKYTKGNKQWFLVLDSVYRAHIEDKAKQEGLDLSQDFCLIVTIRDSESKSLVYNGITKKLDEFNFWHSNIKISEKVSIKL